MPKKDTSTSSSGEQVDVPAILQDGQPLPKMLVFDLDYTLWPFWIDTHVTPPIKSTEGGSYSIDKYGDKLAFYRDVPNILATMTSLADPPLIATASRTHTPDLARTLLKQLKVSVRDGTNTTSRTANTFFDQHQIFPGDKKTHMTRLREKTGVNFHDMLFFDDEHRNKNVEQLGVVFWLVRDGVTWTELENGIKEWRKRQAKRSDQEDEQE